MNNAEARSGVPAQRSGLRLVGAIRLSKYTDASSSPEVQEDMITRTGALLGGHFVGWARDVDVSALKTTPWEREELAAYLNAPEEWDVLIWQRMDRAVRSMSDMADLGRFAKANRKRLVFASGPGGGMLELDFTSVMSEFMMMFLAFAAQLEGQAIVERNQGAAAHLKSIGRWSGGKIPYGFMLSRKVFVDGNEGLWLTEHAKTATIRRKAIALMIAGRNYSEVCRWLIHTKAITPKNHIAELAGREVDPDDTWKLTTVYDMMRSRIVRGHLVDTDGAVVRDASGNPVMHADPLIDDETWFQLVAAQKELEVSSEHSRRKDAHELLGVVKCGTCGNNMHSAYFTRTKDGARVPTFRCYGDKHAKGQPAFSIVRKPVLEYVEEQFLAHVGPFRRTQVVRTAGVDHRAEIEELERDIKELSGRLVRLRGQAADAVEAQIQGLSDRHESLSAHPVTPSREEVVELDTTWRDDWEAHPDWASRRQLLLAVGATVHVLPGNRWTPKEERLSFSVGTDPEADALEDIAYQESL